jgi:hypothetical protein
MSQVTRVDTRRWQVAQTVSHVTLGHMSSSGVMHRDGRRHRERRGKHEVKENITAVHARYRNSNDGKAIFAVEEAKAVDLCQHF